MIGYRKPREPKRLQESTDRAGLRILAADHHIRSTIRTDPSAVSLAARPAASTGVATPANTVRASAIGDRAARTADTSSSTEATHSIMMVVADRNDRNAYNSFKNHPCGCRCRWSSGKVGDYPIQIK